MDDPTLMLANVRDVGGATTASGRTVRSGRLYRSDAPLTGDLAPPLDEWPPRLVIDLRATDERPSTTHPLAGANTRIVQAPLLRAAAPVAMLAHPRADSHGLTPIYRDILGNARAIAEVVRLIATQPGPVLVHCAAGKDRTGVVVAVVQSALGVYPEAIFADYELTQRNMPGVLRRLVVNGDPDQGARLQALADLGSPLLDAPKEVVAIVLSELGAAGGAQQWLFDQGLTAAELFELQVRLLA